MQKWEYGQRIVSVTQSNSVEKPNRTSKLTWFVPTGVDEDGLREITKMGADGWELVSVVPLVSGYLSESWAYQRSHGAGMSATSDLVFYFKRPLPS